ncbi:MAG: cysteine desulfurase family protein [candidate division WOR-3 bacterium]
MKVYLDNASTTKVDERVIEAMIPIFRENYALPTSEFIHTPGQIVREILEASREKVAQFVGASPREIIFTSGGTESNNLAIKGAALANSDKGKHIISTPIESRSVLDSLRSLEKLGFEIEFVPVDSEGFVDISEIQEKIRKDTILVSIQTVNDEVGTIQNIKEITSIIKEKNPDVLIHTDSTYAVGWIPFKVSEMGVDLASFTAHKIHGPKGVGALYVKERVKLQKIIDGGYAELNLRGGTPNIPGIVGFAKALELIDSKDVELVKNMRDYLYQKILEEIPETILLGPRDFSKRHPANLNISFKYVEGESIVLYLDMKNIYTISGSACFSRGLEPSYVIMAMGHSHETAHGSIRFSLSRFNSFEEIDYTVSVLKEVITNLRELSPLGGD